MAAFLSVGALIHSHHSHVYNAIKDLFIDLVQYSSDTNLIIYTCSFGEYTIKGDAYTTMNNLIFLPKMMINQIKWNNLIIIYNPQTSRVLIKDGICNP